jgi:hypothetical protein
MYKYNGERNIYKTDGPVKITARQGYKKYSNSETVAVIKILKVSLIVVWRISPAYDLKTKHKNP